MSCIGEERDEESPPRRDRIGPSDLVLSIFADGGGVRGSDPRAESDDGETGDMAGLLRLGYEYNECGDTGETGDTSPTSLWVGTCASLTWVGETAIWGSAGLGGAAAGDWGKALIDGGWGTAGMPIAVSRARLVWRVRVGVEMVRRPSLERGDLFGSGWSGSVFETGNAGRFERSRKAGVGSVDERDMPTMSCSELAVAITLDVRLGRVLYSSGDTGFLARGGDEGVLAVLLVTGAEGVPGSDESEDDDDAEVHSGVGAEASDVGVDSHEEAGGEASTTTSVDGKGCEVSTWRRSRLATSSALVKVGELGLGN